MHDVRDTCMELILGREKGFPLKEGDLAERIASTFSKLGNALSLEIMEKRRGRLEIVVRNGMIPLERIEVGASLRNFLFLLSLDRRVDSKIEEAATLIAQSLGLPCEPPFYIWLSGYLNVVKDGIEGNELHVYYVYDPFDESVDLSGYSSILSLGWVRLGTPLLAWEEGVGSGERWTFAVLPSVSEILRGFELGIDRETLDELRSFARYVLETWANAEKVIELLSRGGQRIGELDPRLVASLREGSVLLFTREPLADVISPPSLPEPGALGLGEALDLLKSGGTVYLTLDKVIDVGEGVLEVLLTVAQYPPQPSSAPGPATVKARLLA